VDHELADGRVRSVDAAAGRRNGFLLAVAVARLAGCATGPEILERGRAEGPSAERPTYALGDT